MLGIISAADRQVGAKDNPNQIQQSRVVEKRYTEHLITHDMPRSIIPILLNIEFEKLHLSKFKKLIIALVVEIIHI
jgi:hypothetical protein